MPTPDRRSLCVAHPRFGGDWLDCPTETAVCFDGSCLQRYGRTYRAIVGRLGQAISGPEIRARVVGKGCACASKCGRQREIGPSFLATSYKGDELQVRGLN